MNKIAVSFLLIVISWACKTRPDNSDVKRNMSSEDQVLITLAKKANWELGDYENSLTQLKLVKAKNSSGDFTIYLLTTAREAMEKMTDHTTYQTLFTNKSTEQLFQTGDRMMAVLNQLLKLTYSPEKLNGKLVLGHTMIRCSIAIQAIMKINMRIVNKVFPDKEKLDTNRREGFERVQLGVYQMIAGSLIMIGTDYSLYKEEDILLLAQFMNDYIKDMQPLLEKNYRDQIEDQLGKIKKSSTYSSAKEIFNRG